MNMQQVLDLLKGLTIAGGPIAILIGLFVGGDAQRANEVSAAIGAIVSVAGIAWTIIDARRSATVTKAAAIEGVQVHVNTATAPPDVTALAITPAAAGTPQADVVPMIGGPRNDGVDKP